MKAGFQSSDLRVVPGGGISHKRAIICHIALIGQGWRSIFCLELFQWCLRSSFSGIRIFLRRVKDFIRGLFFFFLDILAFPMFLHDKFGRWLAQFESFGSLIDGKLVLLYQFNESLLLLHQKINYLRCNQMMNFPGLLLDVVVGVLVLFTHLNLINKYKKSSLQHQEPKKIMININFQSGPRYQKRIKK